MSAAADGKAATAPARLAAAAAADSAAAGDSEAAAAQAAAYAEGATAAAPGGAAHLPDADDALHPDDVAANEAAGRMFAASLNSGLEPAPERTPRLVGVEVGSGSVLEGDASAAAAEQPPQEGPSDTATDEDPDLVMLPPSAPLMQNVVDLTVLVRPLAAFTFIRCTATDVSLAAVRLGCMHCA